MAVLFACLLDGLRTGTRFDFRCGLERVEEGSIIDGIFSGHYNGEMRLYFLYVFRL